MRSELGEVANRRAWFDVTKLTPEVLQLYKQPLKVQGWDLALLEVIPYLVRLAVGALQDPCACHTRTCRYSICICVVVANGISEHGKQR